MITINTQAEFDDLCIDGDFKCSENVKFNCNILAVGDIWVEGEITAVGEISAMGDVSAWDYIWAEGGISAVGGIWAVGKNHYKISHLYRQ